MVPMVLAAVLVITATPAIADECEDAADDVMRQAREEELAPEELAKLEVAIEQALGKREAGDKMGCLSEVEAARTLIENRG